MSISTITVEDHVRRVMMEICAVMWNGGYKTVPVAPILQLLGIPPESANVYENDYFELDAEFEQMLNEYLDESNHTIPPGTVIQ